MKKLGIIFLCLIAFASNTQSQTVYTFAGSGIPGDIDGNGNSAQFNQPNSSCFDEFGSLYVAEYKNYKIRKVTTTGDVTTFAGSGIQGSFDGIGTAASFYGPSSICYDGSGNFYVSDFLNHRIRKITSAGEVTTFAGSGLIGSLDANGLVAMFNYPADLVTDALGNVFVVDKENHKIRKITPSGDVTTFAGSGTQGSADGIGTTASFNKPSGICIDDFGNFYISDQYNHKIRKITPSGVVTTYAGSGTQGDSDGLANVANFNYPTGICVDNFGNVYVADYSNNKIRKISIDGMVSTYAGSGLQGSDDGPAVLASFHSPTGVCIDEMGIVYVGDQFNHKIRKIDPSTASISEKNYNEMVLYPNPSNGIINFQLKNMAASAIYRIFDVTGKQILVGKLIENITILDMSELQSGIYFIDVKTSNEHFINKIIKK